MSIIDMYFINKYKMELERQLENRFEGHITAEFNFNVIDVLKQHFRLHNIVVVSFRKDRIIIQTMAKPYTMPNIDTKGLYTTIIPLTSMKEYDFDCNQEEVNVIVAKTLLVGNLKSNCINVVRDKPSIIYDEDHCGELKDFVEVTFDFIDKGDVNPISTGGVVFSTPGPVNGSELHNGTS